MAISKRQIAGTTQSISASTSSTRKQLSGAATEIRLVNTGSVICFYALGDSSIDADATGGVLVPNVPLDIPLEDFKASTVETYVAVITASSTATVYLEELDVFKAD